MNANQLRVVGVGTAFLIMFLSGFRLHHAGKPYETLVFTIHKLIGVGMGILLFLIVGQAHQAASLTSVEISAVVVTAIFFLATVTTGSLLSVPVSKPMPEIVSRLNKIFLYFTMISTAITLFVLLGQRTIE